MPLAQTIYTVAKFDLHKGTKHMSNAHLENAIEAAWEARDTITPATTGETRDAIEDT